MPLKTCSWLDVGPYTLSKAKVFTKSFDCLTWTSCLVLPPTVAAMAELSFISRAFRGLIRRITVMFWSILQLSVAVGFCFILDWVLLSRTMWSECLSVSVRWWWSERLTIDNLQTRRTEKFDILHGSSMPMDAKGCLLQMLWLQDLQSEIGIEEWWAWTFEGIECLCRYDWILYSLPQLGSMPWNSLKHIQMCQLFWFCVARNGSLV